MRTLLVDPEPSGHRAFYLSLIVQALAPSYTQLLVPLGAPELKAHFDRRGLDIADFHAISPISDCAKDVVAQAAALVREHRIDRVFFAYFDNYLKILLTSSDAFPCPVTGIWFHPYALDRRYRWLPPLDKRLSHRRAIHNSLRAPANGLKIERIFFTDSSAADALGHLNPTIPATPLPDPWEKVPSMNRSAARQYFSLPQQRSIFLHIGSSEKRKGLSDTLAAFNTLSQDPALKDRLLLLRVGENERIKSMDRALLDDLAANGMAKIIDQFVPESDFIEYFAASDWILLPYRNFRYSSGILSNAIAAERPIIAADHGLIARMVREYNLGLLFHHGSRANLACRIHEAVDSTITPVSSSYRQTLAPEHFIAALRQGLQLD